MWDVMGSLLVLIIVPLIFGYALGSIPFGLLLTRSAGLGDVRDIGSGNIGATNVLRTGSKALAGATLLFDMLKGTAAFYLAAMAAIYLLPEPHYIPYIVGLMAGLGAFLGHLFPVWLKFKGGKGVATYIGVLLGAAPVLALCFCAIWLVVAFTSRYSSLAAIIASLATPPLALIMDRGRLFELYFVLIPMTVLLLWKHRENIARLSRGEESKIGNSAK